MASLDRPCLTHNSLKTPYCKVYWKGAEFIYNFHCHILHSNCFGCGILMNIQQSGLNLDHLFSGMVLAQALQNSVLTTFAEALESIQLPSIDHIKVSAQLHWPCAHLHCVQPILKSCLLSACPRTLLSCYSTFDNRKKGARNGCLYCGGLRYVTTFSYPDLQKKK